MKIAFALLALLSTNILASDSDYYVGHSQDNHHFALYFDEHLGENGAFQTIQTVVYVTKKGRKVDTIRNCQYTFNPDNQEQARIECSSDSGSVMDGAVYLRNKKLYRKSRGEIYEMVCVKNCSNKIPKAFRLTSEDDNC